MSIEASGGWCAPSDFITDLIEQLEAPQVHPELWPPGLTDVDLLWLSTMTWLGDIAPYDPLDLPSFSIRRGGIGFFSPAGWSM